MDDQRSPRFRVLTIALSTIGVIALGVVALFLGLFIFAISSVSGSMKSLITPPAAHHSSASKANYTVPAQALPYIAGIKLSGEINDASAEEIIDKLETARLDSSAVGILFEVNSPGGSVVPSQEIYDEIKTIKQKKPVVVYVREMAASGAYYSSASASKIVANRGSLIGSIGVIMNGFEADKLIQFLKIKPVTIKTGELKDTGSPTRAMNENDKKYLKTLVDETRAQFAADVQAGRGTSPAAMNFMSDGRVVLAPAALNLKLIDVIGTKRTALELVALLSKQTKQPELYYYENVDSFSQLFSQRLSGQVSQVLRDSVSQMFLSNSVLENSPIKAK